ncbi:unnamed protein product [Rotaria sp. Silwood1]|nr:unnamed protein product [Rotaria sp. Silwood1]
MALQKANSSHHNSNDVARGKFYELAKKHIDALNPKFRNKAVITRDQSEKIINILQNKLSTEKSGMHIVHERPRHPQSQGLIERANAILTDALGKWMDNHATTHWSEGLQPVIFSINTRTTYVTKKTPYQLVFGQDSRSDCHHWQAVHQASLSGPVEIDDLQIESFTTETNLYNQKPSQSGSLLVRFSPSKKSTKRSKSNIDIYSSCTNKRNISSTNVPSSSQTFGPLVTIDESRHDIIRESGRINYLKSQSKRQKIYDEYLNVMANSYSKGDLIGIPVDKVDRTNYDAKLMPCLIEERVDHDTIPSY